MSRNRGVQEVAACRKSNKLTHLLRRRLNGMACGRFRGGMSCGGALSLNLVGAVSSPCVLRQSSERKAVESPYHIPSLPSLRTSNTRFAVTEDVHLSQVTIPSTRTKSTNRRDLPMGSGQATPIPQGGTILRRTMSNTLPAPSVLLDQFHESDDYASGLRKQEEKEKKSS